MKNLDEKTYEKIRSWINKFDNGVEVINIINKISTSLVYLIYPIILLILIFNGDQSFWRILFVPAISFILLSLFRKCFNAPRPYEVLDIQPIIKKDTRGKSFPSRHVFSAFVIAMTLYYISVPIGIFIMLLGLIIAIVRVLGGIHFPKDVIVGGIIGILCGIIGWNILFI